MSTFIDNFDLKLSLNDGVGKK